VTDKDADDLIRLLETTVERGKHLALMAHYSHPRELETSIAREAIRRIKGTGAVIRCQAPLIRHVNDDADVWADLWTKQVSVGAVPYYMFVERDTGPQNYFNLVIQRGRMEGFIVMDYTSRFPEASAKLSAWLAEGRIVQRVDVQEGFENAPRTLLRLFLGENFGKQLLEIGERTTG